MSIQLRDLFKLLDRHSDDEIRDAITSEDFSALTNLPGSIQRSIAGRPDIWNDISWYTAIRKNVNVEEFPCVHIAYAASAETSRLITETHGMFSIMIDDKRSEGLVIAYCPWCAAALNTDGSLRLKPLKSE